MSAMIPSLSDFKMRFAIARMLYNKMQYKVALYKNINVDFCVLSFFSRTLIPLLDADTGLLVLAGMVMFLIIG